MPSVYSARQAAPAIRRWESGTATGARSNWLTALFSVLLWTIVGLFFATAGGGVKRALITWYTWGVLAWIIVLIDRRLPVAHDQLGRRLLWHIPLSLLFSALYLCLALAIDMALKGTSFDAQAWGKIGEALQMGGIHWNVPIYWLIVGAYLVFNYHRQAQERQRRAIHLESLLTEARLSALRAQLNPHFLFNALNTVSAYVESEPKLARQMLGDLGDLLRFSLDSADRQELSLSEELDALEHYISIQRARFAGRLQVRLDIPPNLREARVPGLILQPLVENAITHGLSERSDGGEVWVVAREADGYLKLIVRDNGIGLPPHWRLEQNAGIGLSNTSTRLAELYGLDHEFVVEAVSDGGVVAKVRIPYRIVAAGDNKEQDVEVTRAHRG